MAELAPAVLLPGRRLVLELVADRADAQQPGACELEVGDDVLHDRDGTDAALSLVMGLLHGFVSFAVWHVR
jgi:hypothetical protein